MDSHTTEIERMRSYLTHESVFRVVLKRPVGQFTRVSWVEAVDIDDALECFASIDGAEIISARRANVADAEEALEAYEEMQ